MTMKDQPQKSEPILNTLKVNAVAIALLSLPTLASDVPEAVHKRCLDAKDYTGCVNSQKSLGVDPKTTVNSDPFWYEEKSVKQLKVKGEYGRYLVFNGRTIFNAYDYGMSSGIFTGNAWSGSNQVNASGYGSGFTVSSNSRAGAFTYHLDCKDGTADRLGDAAYAQEDTAGWFPVIKDPTAQSVYAKYCPLITTLPFAEDISEGKSQQ